jgi:hypothetical protein
MLEFVLEDNIIIVEQIPLRRQSGLLSSSLEKYKFRVRGLNDLWYGAPVWSTESGTSATNFTRELLEIMDRQLLGTIGTRG